MRFNVGKQDYMTPKAILQRVNRNEFVLVRDFTILLPTHKMLTIRKGFRTDLASVPKIFRSFISVVGNHVEAAIVHDYFCDNTDISGEQNAKMFYLLMRRYNVPKWKAKTMYYCVKWYAQLTGEW